MFNKEKGYITKWENAEIDFKLQILMWRIVDKLK